MAKISNRKVGIILSYLVIAVSAIVNLLYVPILIHFLGQNEYGLYQLMGSFIAYFSIMDFGLSTAVTSFYSRYKAKSEKDNMATVVGISKRLYKYITVVLVIICFVVYLNIDKIFGASLSLYEIQESKKIFILLGINICITLLTNIYTSLITSHERFIFLKILNLVQVVLQPVLVVLLMLKSPSAFNVALIQTLVTAFAAFFKIFYVKFNLKINFKNYKSDKKILNGLIKLSLSVFVVSVVDQIFWKSNQFILGIISGTASVAVYSIASQIYTNYMPLSSSIQGVFLPHVSGLISNGVNDEEMSDFFIKIGRVQFILLSLVLFGFLVFGRDFIHLWVGSSYDDVYLITILILFPFTIDLIQNIGLVILQAKNLYHIRAFVYAFMGILNIILAVFLGRKFDAIGCAVATSISMFIGNGLIMNFIYTKYVNINIKKFWLNILTFFKAIIPTVIIGFLFKYFITITNFMELGIGILIFSIIYSILLWLFVFDNYEKNLISKYIHKFKR